MSSPLRTLLVPVVLLAGCADPAENATSHTPEHGAMEETLKSEMTIGTFDHISFPELSTFQPQRLEGSGELYCYMSLIRFRDSDTRLIIYPNPDGTAISEAQAAELARRFDRFQEALDTALTALPEKTRQLCDDYGIDLRKISDAEIVGNIGWQNVKLDPDGRIECYTINHRVSDNFDIVLGFSGDMRLAYVHFDG